MTADSVTKALMCIDEEIRELAEKRTIDMSNYIRLIAKPCFLNAKRTLD